MTDAAETSDAILAAAAELMDGTGFDDISYRRLGELVGVSERTVYRHFPTRSHLLAELAAWLENQHFPAAAFTTWEQFGQAVGKRFRAFDAAPSYAFVAARAGTISPVGNDYASFFTRAVGALLEDSAPQLNVRDARRTAAALCHFSSAQYWAQCRTVFGMDAEEITLAFRRTAAQVLAGFQPGTLPDGVVSVFTGKEVSRERPPELVSPS